jgi:hypothetical protein
MTLLFFSILYVMFTLDHSVLAAESSPYQVYNDTVKIDITSQKQIEGVAGQIINIDGVITNPTISENIQGIAYISIVDLDNNIPIDLEDWSAQKGIYVSAIAPGKSIPTQWSLRLVQAGSYQVSIIFLKENSTAIGNSDLTRPIASSSVFLKVDPKINLNPGNILPVAFGTPAALIAIFGTIGYMRGKRSGVYK